VSDPVAEPARFAPYVGRQSEPLKLTVERGHIKRFAEAIGETNAVYFDDEAARRAGHPSVVAPATFAIALRPNDVRAGIDIDWRKLLHGEQELTFTRALHAGDVLTIVQRIVGADVKTTKAGVMDVMVLETNGHDPAGALVFSARATILVRR
jgi:acyl dehydratase